MSRTHELQPSWTQQKSDSLVGIATVYRDTVDADGVTNQDTILLDIEIRRSKNIQSAVLVASTSDIDLSFMDGDTPMIEGTLGTPFVKVDTHTLQSIFGVDKADAIFQNAGELTHVEAFGE